VTAKLQASTAVIVTEYRGLTVGQLGGLRRQLRPAGGEYKVYKNTLARSPLRRPACPGSTTAVGPSGDHVRHRRHRGVAKALRDAAKTTTRCSC
jgi:large subunit ribosomal protein L10